MTAKLIKPALIFCTFFVNMQIWSVAHQKLNVAIIGGGIGGSSAAYFLRQLFNEDINLAIFEKSRDLGGRLATVEIDGQNYESGGSIIHPRNLYMKKFVENFGLKSRDHSEEGLFGLYDGRNLIFEESKYLLITLIKIFYRYGFDIYWLKNDIDALLHAFQKIYEFQSKKFAYSNVYEFLQATGGLKFLKLVNQTLNYSMTQRGYGQEIITELVDAIVRVNYGQNIDVQAFVGSVAVAGAQPNLWSVFGGNKLVPEILVKNSRATVNLGCTVKSIKKLVNEKFSVECLDENNNNLKKFDDFDRIILTLPILTEILFEGFSPTFQNYIEKNQMKYHKLWVIFIRGKLIDEFSDLSCVLTCKNYELLNSIGRISPVDFNRSKIDQSEIDDEKIWKIFTNNDQILKNHKLLENFFDKNFQILKIIDWQAYPEYENLHTNFVYQLKNAKFELTNRVYHVNLIESAASAMEMSVIGAKNVALLIFNEQKGLAASHVDVPYEANMNIKNVEL